MSSLHSQIKWELFGALLNHELHIEAVFAGKALAMWFCMWYTFQRTCYFCFPLLHEKVHTQKMQSLLINVHVVLISVNILRAPPVTQDMNIQIIIRTSSWNLTKLINFYNFGKWFRNIKYPSNSNSINKDLLHTKCTHQLIECSHTFWDEDGIAPLMCQLKALCSCHTLAKEALDAVFVCHDALSPCVGYPPFICKEHNLRTKWEPENVANRKPCYLSISWLCLSLISKLVNMRWSTIANNKKWLSPHTVIKLCEYALTLSLIMINAVVLSLLWVFMNTIDLHNLWRGIELPASLSTVRLFWAVLFPRFWRPHITGSFIFSTFSEFMLTLPGFIFVGDGL